MGSADARVLDRLRWGIVGTGKICRSIVPDLRLVSDQEIGVVYSRDGAKAAAFAEEFGIPGSSSDYGELLADASLDLLYLATPFTTHYPLARLALEAGKRVLVEKPLTLTADEAQELFALARERGLFLMEAMWTKFTPGFRWLIDELRAGRIGEPRSVRASFGVPFSRDDYASKWDVERSAGARLDRGVSTVTYAQAALGAEPVGVFARGTVLEDG